MRRENKSDEKEVRDLLIRMGCTKDKEHANIYDVVIPKSDFDLSIYIMVSGYDVRIRHIEQFRAYKARTIDYHGKHNIKELEKWIRRELLRAML